jgi:drug/metabolite transporter (DMT)-like permease
MKPENKAIGLMHLATFLFGFTAILGKLISLSSLNLVWHRMWIASAIFLFFPSFFKKLRATNKTVRKQFLLIGVLVSFHWLTFYGCIKVGNSASLALATFGTITLFAALIEPMVFKVKMKKRELFIGVLVLVGLAFIAKSNPDEEFSLKSTYIQAMLLGIVAAFFAALFSVLNKKYVGDNYPTVLTFLQMMGGFIFLTFLIPLMLFNGASFELIPSWQDIGYLVLLAVICTNIAFSLEMQALKNMSAFTSNLILNMEPIYGIALAIIIFAENQMLNGWFYAGAALIMLTVFIHPMMDRYFNKKAISKLGTLS